MSYAGTVAGRAFMPLCVSVIIGSQEGRDASWIVLLSFQREDQGTPLNDDGNGADNRGLKSHP